MLWRSGSSLTTNREVFDGLPPGHQKAIEIAAAEGNQWTLALYLVQNGAALSRLQSSGIKLMQVSDDVWDAFGKASAQALEESRGDEIFARIHDSYQTSMKSSSGWTSIAEGAYRAQGGRILG